ncbi:MAG: PIG-L family deacetylase [Microbacterium enclense]
MSRSHTRSSRVRRRRRAALVVAIVAVVLVGGAAVAVPFALRGVGDTDAPTAATPTPGDEGAEKTPTPPPSPAPTPPPTSPAAQPCPGEDTLLTVWAHPDDDIIFANPTISAAIAAGECVRTLFVTAGDAGRGLDYTHSRELGILRAYNAMRGSGAFWDESEITLDSGMRVDRLTPQDDDRVSVLFARLPDGNITDGGFPATGYATLSKLLDGAIPSLEPIDQGPAVSSAQLSASLVELAEALRPAQTLTHIPRGSAFAPGDHPDHSAVGTLVRDAVGHVEGVGPGLRYFVGYPSGDLPRNVDGEALDKKVETYRVYSQQDDVIRCADRAACLGTRKFGEWLQRSYPKTEAELQMP